MLSSLVKLALGKLGLDLKVIIAVNQPDWLLDYPLNRS